MEVVIEKLEYLLDSYKHMVNILFTTASVVCVWFVFRMGGIDKVPPEMFSYIASGLYHDWERLGVQFPFDLFLYRSWDYS